MNTVRVIVRMDEEERTAELETRIPHRLPRIAGLEGVLKDMGVGAMHTIELSTPRYTITRTKLAELDGSRLEASRILQVLGAVQELGALSVVSSGRAA